LKALVGIPLTLGHRDKDKDRDRFMVKGLRYRV
jgi:hypothetical protein